MRARLSVDAFAKGVLGGDRAVLARAITLIESTRPEDQALAAELLERLAPHAGGAVRVGVTGAPGAGKSTFLDGLGLYLLERGAKVAVLAVDPSSQASGGSILGDKTRMSRLVQHERAYVRPSPSQGTLGGVARRTRETITLVEAAGFDVVLVETVGVGQSETLVIELVDCLLLLALPNAGDELQGIKKGLLELVDVVAVNKCDGELVRMAERARGDLAHALHYQRPRTPGWTPAVLTTSARDGVGVAAVWDAVRAHREHLERTGELARARASQLERAAWELAEERLVELLRHSAAARAAVCSLRDELRRGAVSPARAARQAIEVFFGEVSAHDGPPEPRSPHAHGAEG